MPSNYQLVLQIANANLLVQVDNCLTKKTLLSNHISLVRSLLKTILRKQMANRIIYQGQIMIIKKQIGNNLKIKQKINVLINQI